MTSMREVEDPKKSGLDKIRRKNLVLMTESNVLLVKDAKNWSFELLEAKNGPDIISWNLCCFRWLKSNVR